MQFEVALWDAINRYAITVGGDPAHHVYGNTARMQAVADVGKIVARVASREQIDRGRLPRLRTVQPGARTPPAGSSKVRALQSEAHAGQARRALSGEPDGRAATGRAELRVDR